MTNQESDNKVYNQLKGAESPALGFTFYLKRTLWQGPQMSALSKTSVEDLVMKKHKTKQ